MAAMIDEIKGERVQLEAAGPLVIRSKGEKLALLMPSAWNFERGGSCRVEAAKAAAAGGAGSEAQMKSGAVETALFQNTP